MEISLMRIFSKDKIKWKHYAELTAAIAVSNITVDEEAFKKNPWKLYAGIFDIESGELLFPEIKDTKADKLYLQAAASLPLLSKVVHINGHKYLDGGIWDSFGLNFAIQNGCDKVVVINTRDKEYQRGKEKTLPLMKVVYRACNAGVLLF